MSASIVPKSIRNIFKRHKKKNQDDNTEATTEHSFTAENPEQMYGGMEAGDDYNLPLALAMSESAQDARTMPPLEAAESGSSIRYMASYSNGPSNHSEALSSAYYFNGIVDYDEHITDGFYDVWGEFNEVLRSKRFPSLKSLKKLRLEDGDLREVVLLNRGRDSVFPHIEDAAQEAMFKLMDCGRMAIAQALAQIVSAQMGGAVADERALVRSWQKCSQKLKRKYRSAVYPIGKLKVGLSRHRAFLYKVLADGLNMGCRLVRGYPYRASSAQAVCLVIIDNTEVIVDLLHQPGRLTKLENGGPDDLGVEVVYAEAPGMPSEPYWIPLGQKSSKRYQPLPEGSSVNEKSASTFVQRIPPDVKNPQRSDRARRQPPKSAFSMNKTPFDPAPTHHGGMDISRDDSSAMSSGARQNSDASSNSSERVGMNTQTSGTSVFSGSNGWPEDAESPRMLNKFAQGHEVRSVASRLPSNNLDETKKSTTSTQYPSSLIQGYIPTVHAAPVAMTSPFQNLDLPPWDDEDDDRNESPMRKQDSEEPPTKPTVSKDDSQIHNKQPSPLASFDSLYDADHNILESEIDMEHVRLGVGSYGEVFKGTWRGTEVAVKRLLEQEVSRSILDEFLLEVKIMKCLRHPNVLLFMGAIMEPPNLAIVTEYLPRGSLYRLLHKTDLVDQRLKLRMARDVAKGMCYLHSFKPPIVHRDLKSPNLLVDKDWTVKVCDFGMSRMKANTYLSGKGAAGTPEWMAPEVLRNERSDEKCDVYSFGVILYELVTGLEPWPNLKPMQVVGAVGYAGQQLPLPAEVDPRIASIIKKCWSIDSHARPSFSDLLKMLSEFDSLPCLPKPT